MPEKEKVEETPVAAGQRPELVEGQPKKPTDLPEPVAKNDAAPEAEASETPAEEEAQPEPVQKMDGEGEETEEEAAKMDGEEEEHPMNEEMVKQVVLGMLKELGLVREEGQGFAQAAEIADLRKSLDVLAPAEDLQKVSGDLNKVVGDIAKVASAIGEIEERLERVEQLPQGTGPVLRDLSFNAVADQTETVLKSLLADATDPQMREAIGQRLTQLQIKKAYQNESGQ